MLARKSSVLFMPYVTALLFLLLAFVPIQSLYAQAPDGGDIPVDSPSAEEDPIVPDVPPEPVIFDSSAAPEVMPAATEAYSATTWAVESRLGLGMQTPVHKFGIHGGPLWTTSNWFGAVELGNIAAIGWRPNTAGYLAGIGHANNGFYVFRTKAQVGTTTHAPIYDMLIRNDGNVGLGTTSPSHKLSVIGGPKWTSSGWTGSVELANATALGWRTNSSGQAFGMGQTNGGLRIFRTTSAPGTNNTRAIYDFAITDSGDVGIGDTSPSAKLDVNGTTRTNILQIDGGSDLAEPFNIAGAGIGVVAIRPGMVVAIDAAAPGDLRIANQPYDRTVAGVISGAGGIQPGLLLQQEGTIADGEHPVALTGRVYVWVDASYGAIQPGDMLTTSATPGHAMKALDHTRAQGAILGKAMTSLSTGKGLVLVLVTLQ